jgi:hypothetical protein
MSMDTSEEFCRMHPERLAEGLCTNCGRSFCAECLTDVDGFPYCPACVDDARERAVSEPPDEVYEEEPPPKRRHRIRDTLVGLFLTGLILVMTFCFSYKNGIVTRIFSQPYLLLSLPKMTENEPGQFRKKETAHFIIYHRNDDLAEWLAKTSEEDLKKIAKDAGADIPQLMKRGKYTIKIAKNPEEYRSLALSTPSTTSEGTTNRETRTVIVNQMKTSYLLHLVLAHEISHLVYSDILNGAYDVPLWVIEGFASYEQAEVDDITIISQRELVRSNLEKDTLIPLAGMTAYPVSEDERDLFYAQSTSVTTFLIDSYGIRKFMAFSKQLESGFDTDSAIKTIYAPDLKNLTALEKKWLASIK